MSPIAMILLMLAGAALTYWALSRSPHIVIEDFREALKTFNSSIVNLPLPEPLNQEKNSEQQMNAEVFRVVVCGTVQLPMIIISVEHRKRVAEVLVDLREYCQEQNTLLESEPCQMLKEALVEVIEEIDKTEIEARHCDASSLTAIHHRFAELKGSIPSLSDRLKKIPSVIKEIYDLLTKAYVKADDDLRQAFLELELKVKEVALARVSFSQPATIKALELDLAIIKDQLVNHLSDSVIEKAETKDPRVVLGVDLGASLAEIKTAYRRKLHDYHPDVIEARVKLISDNPEVQKRVRDWFTTQIQEINQAYETLTKGKGLSS